MSDITVLDLLYRCQHYWLLTADLPGPASTILADVVGLAQQDLLHCLSKGLEPTEIFDVLVEEEDTWTLIEMTGSITTVLDGPFKPLLQKQQTIRREN